MTPLDERRAALISEPAVRTERIKWLWREVLDLLPTGSLRLLIEADDCNVIEVEDEVLGEIMYQKITYGTHSVVECDGVVVCRIS